ncbi:unnamed protein product [Closterium sp. NIES-64]|nr:unnamed protein product [Closterium sp. NIES-64]
MRRKYKIDAKTNAAVQANTVHMILCYIKACQMAARVEAMLYKEKELGIMRKISVVRSEVRVMVRTKIQRDLNLLRGASICEITLPDTFLYRLASTSSVNPGNQPVSMVIAEMSVHHDAQYVVLSLTEMLKYARERSAVEKIDFKEEIKKRDATIVSLTAEITRLVEALCVSEAQSGKGVKGFCKTEVSKLCVACALMARELKPEQWVADLFPDTWKEQMKMTLAELANENAAGQQLPTKPTAKRKKTA